MIDGEWIPMRKDHRFKRRGKAPKIKPIKIVKEKIIDLLFNSATVWVGRLVIIIGGWAAGYFKLNHDDSTAFNSAVATLLAFLLVAFRGKVKENFVKDYQMYNNLKIDGKPLEKTRAKLVEQSTEEV